MISYTSQPLKKFCFVVGHRLQELSHCVIKQQLIFRLFFICIKHDCHNVYVLYSEPIIIISFVCIGFNTALDLYVSHFLYSF